MERKRIMKVIFFVIFLLINLGFTILKPDKNDWNTIIEDENIIKSSTISNNNKIDNITNNNKNNLINNNENKNNIV
jgi:hypothetical protein